jgi:decaprenylphospho-beta-D-ribofuranose 2-oxidase
VPTGLVEAQVSGWGRMPIEPCLVGAPFRRRDLQEAVRRTDGTRNLIARGLGRSYGDSALNRSQGVLLQTRFNRLIDFDESTGVLECEAGVSFADIIETFLPRGWFLPTTPGTKFVTVGGAIAADVHGKNHHRDGTFGQFVEELELLGSDGMIHRCSPEHDARRFWATIGGMGLTGIILSAKFRLHRVETGYFNVEYRRTRDLDEALAAFEATNDSYRYSVAWIDCLARGKNLGRSVLMLANDGRAEDLPARLRASPLEPPRKRKLAVPIDFPSFALSTWSVRAFNTLFYAKNSDGLRLVDYDTFFYPLDGISGWNRIYGRRGFVQYQVLVPRDNARQALVRVLEAVANSRRASFLAVLKACGPQNEGMLSYLSEGFTLALDFPYTGLDLRAFVSELDQLLVGLGGRLYLAKDALMTREVFDEMYPRAEEFRALKAEIDPEHRFSSSQARRLGLVPS